MRALRVFLLKYVGWIQPEVRDIPTAEPLLEVPWRWRFLWMSLEAQFVNAGLRPKGPAFSEVRFYTCAEIPVWVANAMVRDMKYHPGTQFSGMVFLREKSIVFLVGAHLDDRIVAHEMTHMIRGVGGHGPEWFRPEWGNYTGEQPEELK